MPADPARREGREARLDAGERVGVLAAAFKELEGDQE